MKNGLVCFGKVLGLGMRLALMLVVLVSCGQQGDQTNQALEEAVREELVVFAPDEVPTELLAAAEKHEVILLGEEHWVQEHHEFVARMLEPLRAKEYRKLILEIDHAYGWLVDDYVRGGTDSVFKYVRKFFELIIERVRQINQDLQEEERIHVAFMDVNHGSESFHWSLSAVEAQLGDQTVLDGVLSASVDTNAYIDALAELKDELHSNSAQYRSAWGDRWYDLVVAMVDVEISSSSYRRTRDDELREGVILSNIRAAIAANPRGKALVACGGMHARKATLGVLPEINAGEQLAQEHGDELYSIGFMAIRGERVDHFNDEHSYSFDLIEGTDADNLFRIVGLEAGDKMSLLPMLDATFKQDLKLQTDPDNFLMAPPVAFFDAFITYPHVTVLQSL